MARSVNFDVLAVAKGVGFDELGMKISGVVRDSQTHVSGLVAALAALGPAMIPLAAGATALAASFTGLGAAGLLAFVGIRNEMQQGTVLGKGYAQAFKPIIDEFHALSYLSAIEVFTGINTAVSSSRKLFPLLAQDIALFAGQLGQIISHLVPGLLALFVRLNPLFLSVGNQLVKLSAGFERWATTGTGVTKFVQYAEANLPKLEKLLGQVVTAIVHLTQGLVPLGGISLSSLGVMLKLFNAIPVGDLQKIAPIIAGIVLATKTWEIASRALNIVLDANPFVLIASLIIAVGVALVAAYKHSQTFRNEVQSAFHYVKTAALDLGIGFIKYLEIPVLDVFSTIIHGAADAFGWVPKIGPKLRAARAEFDQFRRDADKALHGMEATLNTENARHQYGALIAYLQSASQQHITIETDLYTKHINEFITKRSTGTYTQNADGGMLGEGWNLINERGPEWMFKTGSQVQVFPHGTGGPPIVPATATSAHVTNVKIYVNGGEPRAVVRALEEWAGRGGKIHVSRAVV